MQAKKISSITSVANPGIIAYLKEVYVYRPLIRKLAMRDIRIQYSQSLLGVLWVLIQPLIAVVIYSLIFAYLIKVPEVKGPYPIFVFLGLILWSNFTGLINRSSTSLHSNLAVIKNIYFPKIVLPLSKMIVGLVEMGIWLALVIPLILIWHCPLRWQLVFVPLFVALNILIGLCVAIWLSALTVRYRDFHHVIPYVLNFGIFLTPVFFPTTLVPDKISFIMYVNPIAFTISGLRWAVLGGLPPSINFLPIVIITMSVLLLGIFHYMKLEYDIAELI